MRCSTSISAAFFAAAVVFVCMCLISFHHLSPAFGRYRMGAAAHTPAPAGLPVSIGPSSPPPERVELSGADEIATLEAIQIALSSVADGITHVWSLDDGRLNAAIRPTRSFRDVKWRVCRHVVIMLNSGGLSRSAEGIACRQEDGIWGLEG